MVFIVESPWKTTTSSSFQHATSKARMEKDETEEDVLKKDKFERSIENGIQFNADTPLPYGVRICVNVLGLRSVVYENKNRFTSQSRNAQVREPMGKSRKGTIKKENGIHH